MRREKAEKERLAREAEEALRAREEADRRRVEQEELDRLETLRKEELALGLKDVLGIAVTVEQHEQDVENGEQVEVPPPAPASPVKVPSAGPASNKSSPMVIITQQQQKVVQPLPSPSVESQTDIDAGTIAQAMQVYNTYLEMTNTTPQQQQVGKIHTLIEFFFPEHPSERCFHPCTARLRPWAPAVPSPSRCPRYVQHAATVPAAARGPGW